jgi:DNA-binding transcriptional ArsR family regulator
LFGSVLRDWLDVFAKDPGANQERTTEFDAVFAALAHSARRGILLTMELEGGSMTAGDIAKMFKHAWPTTTRHLQILESAGLLHHERQGRSRRYRIDGRRLEVSRGTGHGCPFCS